MPGTGSPAPVVGVNYGNNRGKIQNLNIFINKENYLGLKIYPYLQHCQILGTVGSLLIVLYPIGWGGLLGPSVGDQSKAALAEGNRSSYLVFYVAVLRIRIRIHRIHMFLGLQDPDPDPLVRGMDPDPDPALDPDPDPSTIMQK